MDIYEAIKQDHDKARRMLKDITATEDGDGERREALFAPLKDELMMHQHVEESVFYSVLKEREPTRADALEAINEHHIVDSLLEELDIMPKGNDEWTAKFGVLKEIVDHHMKEEEGEFFADARKVIDKALSRRMADEMLKKKAAGLAALRPISGTAAE